MKAKTIFYSTGGALALQMVAMHRAQHGPDTAFTLHAEGYAGERIRGDAIEFTDDVPEWQRKRIAACFEAQQAREARVREYDEMRRMTGKAPPMPIESEDEFRRSMSSHAPAPERRGPGRPRKEPVTDGA